MAIVGWDWDQMDASEGNPQDVAGQTPGTNTCTNSMKCFISKGIHWMAADKVFNNTEAAGCIKLCNLNVIQSVNNFVAFI